MRNETRRCCSYKLVGFLAISGSVTFSQSCALAQSTSKILPDQTLGAESSIVQPSNSQPDRIDIHGGAIRGTNLFHSFQDFNVNEGQSVYFANPPKIEAIFSRVTGSNPSMILGRLGVSGFADLFLLNSNGIIFGSNASLDLHGSFIASTANRINFADGTQFSTQASQTNPLLTISVPIGLQFGEAPGSIDSHAFLQVPNGKTLALVGGDVMLKGSILIAPGGRIELGGVGDNSQVSLAKEPSWSLEYSDVHNFQDIQLDANVFPFPMPSFIDVSNQPDSHQSAGSVQLQGRNIKIANSQILTTNTGAGLGGSLTVSASETVEIRGTQGQMVVPTGLFSGTTADGGAGNININAKKLLVQDGGSIIAGPLFIPALGAGEGGNISIVASDSVELVNGGIIQSRAIGQGNAGDITLSTARLIIREGGRIETSTLAQGRGGNILVGARDFVLLSGVSKEENLSSGLFANATFNSTGAGGNIQLTTGNLMIWDGAEITASSLTGQAGNVDITANSLFMNRGSITAETRLSKDREGANLNLQVSDLLLLGNESLISATAFGNADGGNINTNTNYLIALPSQGANGSDIIANAEFGDGGRIEIAARRIFGIESRPDGTPFNDITASSEFGTDGVVEINTLELEPQREELPANLVDVSSLVSQNLCKAGQGSQFTLTGRGGLPHSPNEAFSSDDSWEDWRIADASQPTLAGTTPAPRLHRQQTIVEAQGWLINPQGKVVLTSEPIVVVPRAPVLTASGC
jgi:filamentous hemagglutinin family protein